MDNTVKFETAYNTNPNEKKYIIDKNVPVPSKTHFRGRWDPVLKAMEEGDSISFATRKESDQLLSALRNKGFHNCVRKQSDGSFRVWKLGSREDK